MGTRSSIAEADPQGFTLAALCMSHGDGYHQECNAATTMPLALRVINAPWQVLHIISKNNATVCITCKIDGLTSCAAAAAPAKPTEFKVLVESVVNSYRALQGAPSPLHSAKFKAIMAIIRQAVRFPHKLDLESPNWRVLKELAKVQPDCLPPPHWAPSPAMEIVIDGLAGNASSRLDSQASAQASTVSGRPILPTRESRSLSAASQPPAAATEPTGPQHTATESTSATFQPTAAPLQQGKRASLSAAAHGVGQSGGSPADVLVSSNPFSGTGLADVTWHHQITKIHVKVVFCERSRRENWSCTAFHLDISCSIS